MRHYDFFFWCSKGGHFIRKENAVIDVNGAPRCPVHKRMLRVKPSAGGEQRDRLYPRRRVA